MGETPREIESQIEQARNRLGQDLNELEYRVKTELDWRTQFNRRPWAFIGAAFGISFLLGWMFAPAGVSNES
jgi:ElaB/YqjD/DUF883 family membrane-anchored ribosome-binding protein